MLAAAMQLSEADVGLDHLPGTGSYREEVIALFVPDTPDDQQVRLQALIGLLMLAKTDKRAQAAASPYGMLTDRFGVTWIFGVTPAH